jgi:hypothetical protein
LGRYRRITVFITLLIVKAVKRVEFIKKPDIKSKFRPSLFWDADEIDAVQHAAYVIGRVLDYGDVEDVAVLREMYPDEKIIEVIRTRRGLFPQTGKYWAIKFNIPFNEVSCLKNYYPKGQ